LIIQLTKERISYRLAVICVAMTLILGSLFGLAQVASDFRDEITLTSDRIQRILNGAEINATNAALRLDDIQAAEIVKGLFVYDFIVRARIEDERGGILGSLERQAPQRKTRWLTDRFTESTLTRRMILTAPGNSNKVIGTLDIEVNFDLALSAFYERSWFALISEVIRNIILGGLLVILFYFLVTRALMQLAKSVGDANPESLENYRLKEPEGHVEDELGQLTRSINSFLRTISESQRKQASAEENLKRANDELERRVDERTSELRERELTLRLITDNIPVLVAYIDADGIYRFVNAQYEKDFALNRDNILGKTVSELWGTETYEKLKHHLDQAAGGEISIVEFEAQTAASDQPVIRRSTYVPNMDHNGNPQGFYVLSEDITDSRNREQELRNALIEAETANRTKTEFLANMSHELRTPLNAVIGFSELLTEKIFGELANEQQEEYVTNIYESGHHLLHLINDVLDVSAIEAHKLELNESEIEIEPTVESVLRMVKSRAEAEGVELKFEKRNCQQMILADERRMKQILVNLLSNAVKFTNSGGRVTTNWVLNEDQSMDISISDTGIGMREEEIEIALQKFGQIKSSDTDVIEGTGLGLPLTKGLVEAHGGNMIIESVFGEGTTVIVQLPSERVVDDSLLEVS